MLFINFKILRAIIIKGDNMKLSKNGLTPQQEDVGRFNQPMTVKGLTEISLKEMNS